MVEYIDDLKITVKTIFGLEEVLAKEITEIGGKNVELANRAVTLEGDKELIYKCNYYLRTALKVLIPIKHFKANSENELYKNVKKIEWEKFINVTDTFAVEGVTSSKIFTHSKYVALKTKDAIADRFREFKKLRPNVDVENPTLRVNVHIYNDEVTISLDSSGSSLHKRGYRKITNIAPLNEVLAAGLILLSGWDKKSNFVDGMCGSGTLPIEAALIAKNIPPGKFKTHFGFMNWKDFDKVLWNKIVEESETKIISPDVNIIASDISPQFVQFAIENIKHAGLEGTVTTAVSNFEKLTPPEGEGVVILNPPYGERIKSFDINNLYKSIGDSLKQNFAGYEAWIISSNKDAFKHLGLRTSKRITLYNGPLESKFNNYSLYKGSKKSKYKNEQE